MEDLFEGRRGDFVDKLPPEELKWIDELLANYGLWGDKAALSPDSRMRYLGGRDERVSILLDLFKAPQIKARLDAEATGLNSKTGYYEILAGVLILAVLNARPTLNLLTDLVGSRVLDRGLQQDRVVTEFIDFRRGEVNCKSSVAARFMLGNVLDANILTDVLVRLARALDKIFGVNRYYAEILRNWCNSANWKPFCRAAVPRSDVKPSSATTRGSRSLATVRGTRSSDSNIRLPRWFSKTSTGPRGTLGPLTPSRKSEIGTTLTRSTITAPDCSCRGQPEARAKKGALPSFDARGKSSPSRFNPKGYIAPYRVANAIGEFFDAFAASFTAAELEEIKNAALFIKNRTEASPPALQNHRKVRDCLGAMNRICTLIESSTSPRPA